ncbi:MAG: DnaJ domain-containing protein [Limisphaerales bacterium]
MPNMDDVQSYYEVLEVPEGATLEEVKAAFRRLSNEYHPDRVPSHLTKLRKDAEERFKQINEANQVLRDPEKRRQYDELLKELREGASRTSAASYSHQPPPTPSAPPQPPPRPAATAPPSRTPPKSATPPLVWKLAVAIPLLSIAALIISFVALFATQDRSGKNNRGEVGKKMNQLAAEVKETVGLPQYDWATSGLSHSLYRDEKASLWWWLQNELEKNPKPKRTLEGLAEVIHKQADGCGTIIYEYSRRGENIWAAGAYTTSHKWASGEEYRNAKEQDKRGTESGFICYSSDNGKNWVRQWFSGNSSPDPVYGIYFSDSREGWALTFKGILHTSNKGVSWERLLECDDSDNLFILENNVLIVSGPPRFRRYYYTSGDRGLSWNKMSVNSSEEYNEKFGALKNRFGGSLVHYGGICSYEGTDKE